MKMTIALLFLIGILVSLPACSREVRPDMTPSAAAVSSPPGADASGLEASQEETGASESSLESENNSRPPLDNAVKAQFETDLIDADGNAKDETIKFALLIPNTWTAKDNEIYLGQRRIAQILPCVINEGEITFGKLSAKYADAVSTGEFSVGAYSGRYYHMQTEITAGGMGGFENEFFYYWDCGDQLVNLAFYPSYGVGIGTQREEFEAGLAGIELGFSETEAPQNDASAVFQLGLRGTEQKNMRAGDSIGGWILKDLQIAYFPDQKIRMLEALFQGDVTLKGTVARSPLADDAYDFTVSEEDRAKMPHYISPEMTQQEALMFMLDIPDGIANAPSLSYGERLECAVTVSDYRFVFAYMSAPSGAAVTRIDVL